MDSNHLKICTIKICINKICTHNNLTSKTILIHNNLEEVCQYKEELGINREMVWVMLTKILKEWDLIIINKYNNFYNNNSNKGKDSINDLNKKFLEKIIQNLNKFF